MTIARMIAFVPMLALAASLHAQECSGGPDGGADATGHQCNDSASVHAYATRADAAPADVASGTADSADLRNKGLELYARGRYGPAVDLFRSAATKGDMRSAEMIVLMHRYNAQLYGGRVTISAVEAKHWADAIARQANASTPAGASGQR